MERRRTSHRVWLSSHRAHSPERHTLGRFRHVARAVRPYRDRYRVPRRMGLQPIDVRRYRRQLHWHAARNRRRKGLGASACAFSGLRFGRAGGQGCRRKHLTLGCRSLGADRADRVVRRHAASGLFERRDRSAVDCAAGISAVLPRGPAIFHADRLAVQWSFRLHELSHHALYSEHPCVRSRVCRGGHARPSRVCGI